MLKPSVDDLIKSAIRSILKNKSRTVLTSLGIIIGVTSVILLTSIGNGLKQYINSQFESLGANSIFVSPGKIFNDKGGFNNSEGGRFISTVFTQNDVLALKRALKNDIVMPISATIVEIKAGKITKSDISFVGGTYQYGQAANTIPDKGRWFTKEEEAKKSDVIVLGYGLANDLFPKSNPLGRKVIIKSKNLKVIGVLPKKGGSFGGPDIDQHAFTPIGNVWDFNGNQNINQIFVKIANKDAVDETKAQIKKIMLKKFDKDAFTVFDSSQLLTSINSIISTLTIALSGIAAISLVVGGIGIMNIMLVTVSERTREIGLRKAVGAYPRAILIQFLIEAVLLSAIGGVSGLLLGTLGTLAINQFFPAQITVGSVILALGVSSLVGIIFGVAPARRASKLAPIEALRYE